MNAFILDLDGTLVDSVALHVITWHHALLDEDIVVPTRRIHAGIGLSSDRLVANLLGRVPDADLRQAGARWITDDPAGLVGTL